MPGLCFEDFTAGDEIRHVWSRTVTEADNTWFSLMTLNPQPLHIDAAYAATTPFGQRVVNGMFTLSLVVGMSVYDTTLGTLVANLGLTDVRFPKPVFHGDTLRAVTTVVSKRESRSHPDAGIVELAHRGLNQDGVEVLSCRRTVMVQRRTRA